MADKAISLDVHLNGDGCWPDLKEKGFTEATFSSVALLDKGMKSGLPSISVRLDMPDGSVVIGQTTARLFCLAAKTFMEKYPELFQ